MNPANWMLDVAAPASEKRLGVDFEQLWAQSAMAAEVAAQVEALCVPPTGGQPLTFVHAHAQPVYKQFTLLLARALTTHWRLPAYNLLRYLVTLGLALSLGLIYWDRGMNRWGGGALACLPVGRGAAGRGAAPM